VGPELAPESAPTFDACVHCGCTIARPCESEEQGPEDSEPHPTYCTRVETDPLCSRCGAFPHGFTNVALRSQKGEPQVIMPATDAPVLGLDLVENSLPPVDVVDDAPPPVDDEPGEATSIVDGPAPPPETPIDPGAAEEPQPVTEPDVNQATP